MTITQKDRIKKELELLSKLRKFVNKKDTEKIDVIEFIETLENEKRDILNLMNEKNV